MDLLAERFKQRSKLEKTRKAEEPNTPDADGRLVIRPFDTDEYKEWAKEQIRYLQVSKRFMLLLLS